MTVKRILLTGFGPFAKERVNPSGRAVIRLNGRSVLGVKIVGVELPVVFREAGNLVIEKIDEVDPIAVISSPPACEYIGEVVQVLDQGKPCCGKAGHGIKTGIQIRLPMPA